MPDGESDKDEYAIGRCLISKEMPDFRCVKFLTDFYKDSDITHSRFISDGSEFFTGLL
jgi:hypothetical protein